MKYHHPPGSIFYGWITTRYICFTQMRVIATIFFLRDFFWWECASQKQVATWVCYLTHPTRSQSPHVFCCILNRDPMNLSVHHGSWISFQDVSSCQFPAREVSVYYGLYPLVTWIEWNIIKNSFTWSGMLDLGGCFILIFYSPDPDP